MIYLLLLLLGLTLGSFVNALVWRLHQQSVVFSSQSSRKKEAAKQRTKSHGLKAKDLSILRGRSMCVHCRHTLAWYDLVPVLSWVFLRGTCRYCKQPISMQYPLVELGTALTVVASYLWWPLTLVSAGEWLVFAFWVGIVTLLVALTVYDLRWMLLPNKLMYPLGGLAVLFVLTYSLVHQTAVLTDSLLGAVLVGGFFYVLYQVSGGAWIGGGDVRYGFIMGVLLGWQKAILAVALASYIGTVIVLVLVIMHKYKKKMRIPFGPLLALGTWLSFLFGAQLIDWYLVLTGF